VDLGHITGTFSKHVIVVRIARCTLISQQHYCCCRALRELCSNKLFETRCSFEMLHIGPPKLTMIRAIYYIYMQI